MSLHPLSSSSTSQSTELSPYARAVAYALRSGDREVAERLSSVLLAEAPQEALSHFIDAQLAFASKDWLRLIYATRRCWQLGGQGPWVTLMLGGVALRCQLSELVEHLSEHSSSALQPLDQIPEDAVPSLKRALLSPLPPSPRSSSSQATPQGSPPPPHLTRFQPRSAHVQQEPPEWMDRSLKHELSASAVDATSLEWLDRSATRVASTSLLPDRLPEWMSVGTHGGEGLTSAPLETPTRRVGQEEGLSAGLQLCEGLELPSPPLLALPLPGPTLHQAQQEPRRLRGRFLLVAYSEGLSLVDLSKPARPWYFKKADLDEVRVEQLVSQWSMSVIFSDMRVIQFEVSQGVTGSLEPYVEGGVAFKRWLAEGG